MNKRRIGYLLCVAALISVAVLTAIVSGIGATQGRVHNILAWNSVYATVDARLESNYLVEGGQTVLLEKWDIGQEISSRTEPITLKSTKGILEGTISCVTESAYITASIDNSDIATDEVGVSVDLVITLTDAALELSEITEVSVRVEWVYDTSTVENTTCFADFKIDIYPENAAESKDDASVGLKSNYLVSGGNVVLLNDWIVSDTLNYRTQNIELVTYIGEITGTLNCETDSELVSVSLNDSQEAVKLTVGSEEKNVTVLKVSLLEEAAYITEKTELRIRVSWTPDSSAEGLPTMWSDFVVNILPENMETAIDDTGADLSAIDMTEIPSEFSWEEPVIVPISCPENTETIELSCNGDCFTVGTGFCYDGTTNYVLGESMKVKIDALNQTEVEVRLYLDSVAMEQTNEILLGVTAYANGSAIASGEKVLNPKSDADEEFIMLENETLPSKISLEEYMFFEINIPSDSTSLKISCNEGAFPTGIRYKADDELYVMNQKNEEIELLVEGKSSIVLYIDFSCVEEPISEIITVKVTAYKGIYEISSEEFQCDTTLKTLAATYELNRMIIHHNTSISLRIEGEDEQTSFEVQKFSPVDGQMAYVEDENDFGLTVKTENGVLTISNEEGEADAGAYRIIILREQNEIELKRIEIPFFIHY